MKLRGNALLSLLAIAAAPAAIGCAGAQTDLTADTARYPISLSGALIDPDGKPVYAGEDLEVVGGFTDDATKVGFVYAWTGIDYDISDDVNAQVENAGGEGIIRLQSTTEQCGWNFVFPLTLLPIWPGCANVSVTGEIVRRKKPAAEPAAAPAAPPGATPPSEPAVAPVQSKTEPPAGPAPALALQDTGARALGGAR